MYGWITEWEKKKKEGNKRDQEWKEIEIKNEKKKRQENNQRKEWKEVEIMKEKDKRLRKNN